MTPLSLVDILFHPAVMAVILLCFALSLWSFLQKKWQPSRKMRTVLGVIALICIVYGLLIAAVSVGFGGAVPPIADPVMPA